MFCNLEWLHIALQVKIQGVHSKIKNCPNVVQKLSPLFRRQKIKPLTLQIFSGLLPKSNP